MSSQEFDNQIKRIEKLQNQLAEKDAHTKEVERRKRVINALGLEKDKLKINSEASTSQSSNSKSQKM